MATTKETVKICDICGERVSDGGETWIGGHPHQGWFSLHQRGGSTCLTELNRIRDWDICSKECLKTFVENYRKFTYPEESNT